MRQVCWPARPSGGAAPSATPPAIPHASMLPLNAKPCCGLFHYGDSTGNTGGWIRHCPPGCKVSLSVQPQGNLHPPETITVVCQGSTSPPLRHSTAQHTKSKACHCTHGLTGRTCAKMLHAINDVNQPSAHNTTSFLFDFHCEF